MDRGENEVWKCAVPIKVGLRDEKKAVIGTLKWELMSTDIEAFLRYSGMSESQCANTTSFSHSLRNERFFMQLEITLFIKLCDNVILEGKTICDRLR